MKSNRFQKVFIYFMILGLLGFYIATTTISDESKSGSRSTTFYVGGSGPGNYSTIQSAIDAAASGDTVFVYNGTYNEPVQIPKKLNLYGQDRNNTTIDYNGNIVVNINANEVNVSGFTIQNGEDYGVLIVNYDDILIKNNNIKLNGLDGVYIGNSACRNIICENNISFNNLHGIHLGAFGSHHNIMYKNIIYSNNHNGINIYRPDYCIIRENIIHKNNDKGISISSNSNNNSIIDNIILNNSLGIFISQYCNDSNIYHNNFLNNSQNVYNNGNNFWDNGYPSGGNYWDDNTGFDSYHGANQDILGSDGIGDTPYNVSNGDNNDNYPLMQPWNGTSPVPPLNTVYVNGNYNSSTLGWQYDHFDIIQDGIDAVAENGTVYVYNGTYNENVVVNKSIDLIGENKTATIIDGNETDVVVRILNDSVNISHFKIIYSGFDAGPGDDSGICILSNSTIVKHCVFEDNECAVMIFEGQNKIINCTLFNNWLGLWIRGGSHHCIDNNFINYTGNMGIIIDYTDNCIVKNNKALNNAIGTRIYASNNNLIFNNDYLNNWYTGLQIHKSSTINNKIVKNSFQNNEIGIDIFNSANNNTIYNNTFIENNKSANDNDNNYWYNQTNLIGNYWDNYNGSDADGDGIGDTPYYIPGGDNQDMYPFIEENGWLKTLDVDQDIFNRGFPIRHAIDGDWAGAQSFKTSNDTLTRVDVYIRKFGTPEFNLTLEIREDAVDGTLIESFEFPVNYFDGNWQWLNLDIDDIYNTTGKEYFIVCPPAPSGVTTSFGYEWGYAFEDQYPDGSFWFTRDGGGLWRDLPTMYEFAFKTYGYI